MSDRQLSRVVGSPYSGRIAERVREYIGILPGATIELVLAFYSAELLERRAQKISSVSEATYFEREEMLKSEPWRKNHVVVLNGTLGSGPIIALGIPKETSICFKIVGGGLCDV